MSSQYATALSSLHRPIRVAYPVRTANGAALCVRYLKKHWKKITVAAAGGVFAGFLTGAVSSRVAVPLSQVVYAATARTPAPQAALDVSTVNQQAMAEVSRLRAENQQLQAMLDDLRKHSPRSRTHHARVRRRARGHAA